MEYRDDDADLPEWQMASTRKVARRTSWCVWLAESSHRPQ